MCGIFGIKGINVNIETVRQELEHRGPDFFASKTASDWTFAHSRLSIIDLSEKGNQPIEIDGDLLIFNGEIYNYIELKQEYLNNVETFSCSDAEILLLLLQRYGLNILNKLNGMFAFAFFDNKNKSVHLVRDRYGVKPLYYWAKDGKFAFCSEDSALINILKLPYIFNDEYKDLLIEKAISDFDENTCIRDIYQVCPGEYLKINDDCSIEKTKWYNYSDYDCGCVDYEKDSEVIEHFEYLLTDSIKLRHRSDVPVAITLSGGLDSSLIYVLSKENLGTDYGVFTYSNKNKNLDEFEKVKRLTSEYGDRVTRIDYGDETLEIFSKSLQALNSPIWTPAHTAYYSVYKKINENNYKVVIEGHGSDEILGGWAYTFPFAIKESLANFKFKLSYDIYKAYKYCDLAEKSNSGLDFFQLFKFNKKDKNCFEGLLEYIFTKKVLPINLRCWDRLSMAHSVESRSPFLDFRLVEFTKKLPLRYKINKIGNKAILRKILYKYGKNYIADNKLKQPYLASEGDFLSENCRFLLKYYDNNKFNYDILNWEQGNFSNGYDPRIYRAIAFEMLREHYSKESLSNSCIF